MAGGNVERKRGRNGYTVLARDYATQLTVSRYLLDGMNGDDPEFSDTLASAERAAMNFDGVGRRMDRGGNSRRAASARIMSAVAMPQEFVFDMSTFDLPQSLEI